MMRARVLVMRSHRNKMLPIGGGRAPRGVFSVISMNYAGAPENPEGCPGPEGLAQGDYPSGET